MYTAYTPQKCIIINTIAFIKKMNVHFMPLPYSPGIFFPFSIIITNTVTVTLDQFVDLYIPPDMNRAVQSEWWNYTTVLVLEIEIQTTAQTTQSPNSK